MMVKENWSMSKFLVKKLNYFDFGKKKFVFLNQKEK